MMTLSDTGRAFIEREEGCKLTAYLCPAGKWTIGYGHTGPDVFKGLVITQAHADELLEHDAVRFAVGVEHVCPVAARSQFDAMLSLAYNIGSGNFAGSTLAKLHAEGHYAAAQDQFREWSNINHVHNDGLAARRAREAHMYGAS